MKLLLAIDDSDCSKAAFENVLERSWPLDTEFRVISVIEPVYAQFALGYGYAEPVYEAQREYTQHCRQMIDEKVERLKKKFAASHITGEVFEGNVTECILSDACQYSADLLVVGSHGRRGFEKLLLGSVAEHIATHSPCSVEIIKQKQEPAKKSTDSKKNAALV